MKMLKVKLVGVDVNVLVKEFDNSVEVCDFEKSGVYCVDIGSRGEIEKVSFVSESDEVVLREKEDIISDKLFSINNITGVNNILISTLIETNCKNLTLYFIENLS